MDARDRTFEQQRAERPGSGEAAESQAGPGILTGEETEVEDDRLRSQSPGQLLAEALKRLEEVHFHQRWLADPVNSVDIKDEHAVGISFGQVVDVAYVLGEVILGSLPADVPAYTWDDLYYTLGLAVIEAFHSTCREEHQKTLELWHRREWAELQRRGQMSPAEYEVLRKLPPEQPPGDLEHPESETEPVPPGDPVKAMMDRLLADAESQVNDLWNRLVDMAPMVGEQFLAWSMCPHDGPEERRRDLARRFGTAALGFFARALLARHEKDSNDEDD